METCEVQQWEIPGYVPRVWAGREVMGQQCGAGKMCLVWVWLGCRLVQPPPPQTSQDLNSFEAKNKLKGFQPKRAFHVGAGSFLLSRSVFNATSRQGAFRELCSCGTS